MTLEEIYYISQIAAAIAILASLIFVGVQLRQNSEQIKANTRSNKASAGFEATHSWAATNELLLGMSDEILRLGLSTFEPGKLWNDFSDIERMRLSLSQRSMFQKLEGQYFLFKYGSLDEAIWVARRNWAAGFIKVPVHRQWWEFEKSQSIWSGEFVAAIESACDAAPTIALDGRVGADGHS